MADIGSLTAISPADQESLPAALEKFLRDKAMLTDDCLPAVVVSYNRASNIATVRPIIARVTVSDVQVNRQQIVEVPVLAYGGGGFVINFPVQAGDIGWIKACDRDLDFFKQSFSSSDVIPPTARMHQFSDSWFIPDQFNKYTIGATHANDAVFQSLDGTQRFAVNAAQVTMGSGSTTIVVTGSTITATVGGTTIVANGSSVTATSSQFTFNGPVQINGATTMNGPMSQTGGGACSFSGNMTGSGSIQTTGEGTFNGIKVSSHKHVSAAPGSDTSGPHN